MTSGTYENPEIELARLVREFFQILEIREVSDNGTEFCPNVINSCRVMDMQRLHKIMPRMKELASV